MGEEEPSLEDQQPEVDEPDKDLENL